MADRVLYTRALHELSMLYDHTSPYDRVSVLGFSWGRMSCEANDLLFYFQHQLHYNLDTFSLDVADVKKATKFRTQLSQWVTKNDGEKNLLIVFYEGNTVRDYSRLPTALNLGYRLSSTSHKLVLDLANKVHSSFVGNFNQDPTTMIHWQAHSKAFEDSRAAKLLLLDTPAPYILARGDNTWAIASHYGSQTANPQWPFSLSLKLALKETRNGSLGHLTTLLGKDAKAKNISEPMIYTSRFGGVGPSLKPCLLECQRAWKAGHKGDRALFAVEVYGTHDNNGFERGVAELEEIEVVHRHARWNSELFVVSMTAALGANINRSVFKLL